MFWENVWKGLERRGKELLKFAWSFLILRTRVLIAISQEGGLRERLEPGVLFLALAFALSVGLTIFISGEEAPSLSSLFSQLLWRIVASLFVWAPLFPLYWWLKRDCLPFLINVMCFQQVLAVLLLGVTSAEFALPEPARTDFANLEKGIGQGTAAYDFTCGMLEGTARLLLLGRGIEDVGTKVQHAQKAFDSGTGSFDDVIAAHNEQLNVINKNLTTQFEQVRAQEKLAAEYNATYPNVRLSQDIFFYGSMALGIYSLLHILIGLFLGVVTWLGRAITLGGIVAAALGMALCGYVAASLGAYPDPKEFDVLDPDTGEPFDFPVVEQMPGDPAATLKKYERSMAEFNAGRARREGRVRAMFDEAKVRCPHPNNYGLW